MILRAKVKAEPDLGGVCCEKMKATLLGRQPFLGMRIWGMRGWRINPKWWEIEEGVAA